MFSKPKTSIDFINYSKISGVNSNLLYVIIGLETTIIRQSIFIEVWIGFISLSSLSDKGEMFINRQKMRGWNVDFRILLFLILYILSNLIIIITNCCRIKLACHGTFHLWCIWLWTFFWSHNRIAHAASSHSGS